MKCGCKIVWPKGATSYRSQEIRFCPLHAAAEEMKAALDAAPAPTKGVRLAYFRDEIVKWFYGLRFTAIAKAEGRKP